MIRFMPIKPKIEIEWRKCWKQNAAKKIVRRVSLWIWWWKWSPCFGPCRKCRKIAFYGLCNKQAHVITMRALKVTTVALVQKSLRNCSIRSNGLLKASMLVIIYFNCSLPMPPNAVLQCLPMQFSNAVFHLVRTHSSAAQAGLCADRASSPCWESVPPDWCEPGGHSREWTLALLAPCLNMMMATNLHDIWLQRWG